jgi:hypothetical protein
MATRSIPNIRLLDLLDERDVARITRMSLASVRRWRLLRRGPRYLKIGSSVRYRPEDLFAWLDSRPSSGSRGEAR